MLGGYNNYQARVLLHCFIRANGPMQHASGKLLLLSAGRYLLSTPESTFCRPPLQSPFRRLLGKDLCPLAKPRVFRERGVRLHPPRKFNKRLREELHESLKVNVLPLLRYEDRNSMAFSVESRVPFLTPELAQFLLSAGGIYHRPDGLSKAVFRKAMQGLVPDAILNRRDKVGFATPERDWLVTNLHSWLEETFNSPSARRIPAFVPSQLNAAWARAKEAPTQFGLALWRCVNLILWLKSTTWISSPLRRPP